MTVALIHVERHTDAAYANAPKTVTLIDDSVPRFYREEHKYTYVFTKVPYIAVRF